MGIKLDKNKYNQKLVVIFHPFCHYINMWKLLVALVVINKLFFSNTIGFVADNILRIYIEEPLFISKTLWFFFILYRI